MEQGTVMEVNANEPMQSPDQKALSMTGDTATDLAAIARELGVQADSNGNVIKPQAAQPEPPAAQPQATQNHATPEPAPAVEVPAKFQNPDGTVNVEKVTKAEANVDEAIARYKAKEKEYQTLQNRVNNPPPLQAPVVQQPQYQPQAQAQPSQLEVQVAQDILNETAALLAQGYKPQEAQALATARVQVHLQNARYQAEVSATQELRQKVEDNERSRELDALIKSDPWLASQEAIDTLWKVRQENPWINSAPKPFEAAYTFHKGRTGHAPQVQTPNPTGQTAKAPPAPVGPVTRVQKTVDIGDTNALKKMDMNDLEGLVKSRFPGIRLK